MRITEFAASATAACVLTCASVALAPTTAGTPPTEDAVVTATEPLSTKATLPGSVGSSRIHYWSTGAADVPTPTSAAVYFPPGPAPEGGWPVIAWAHGTVGLGDTCAYSVNGPSAVERDWDYLSTWLEQGYAIVAADYAGLGGPGEHPYLNGVVEAHNIVDAVTAATRHYSSLAKSWAVVGQSQGGGAAMFTARYATEFGGRELDYRGAVGTGVPAHIEDILLPLGPGVPGIELSPHTTAYALYILNGLRTTYPELDIASVLNDSGRHWLDRAQHSCINPFGEELAANQVVLGDLFERPLAQLPDLHGLLTRYMGLPTSGYDRPVFLGQGLYDTDVITPQTLRFAAELTARGEPVTLHTYPADHSDAVNASTEDSLPFVRQLFSQ